MTRYHHSIGPSRQLQAFEREGLPEEPFYPVALYCSPDLAGDREAQAWRIVRLTREDVEDEFTRSVGTSTPRYSVEVSASRQPSPSRAGAGPGALRHHTVSRLRPLARRCLSVSRPALVRIRLRKPWARARLRFFGW